MPVKSFNNAAAVWPPRRHHPDTAPADGGNTGISYLQYIANTPEGTALLPTSSDAVLGSVAKAERESAVCAGLPWEDEALLQHVMLRGETLMDQARHQRETGLGAPPSSWRLSTKKSVIAWRSVVGQRGRRRPLVCLSRAVVFCGP